MAYVSWFQKKFILIPLVVIVVFVIFIYKSCNQGSGDASLLIETKKQIKILKSQLSKLEKLYKELPKHKREKLSLNDISNNDIIEVLPKSDSALPTIYFVTPTYTRYTQQADLVRLSQTLKHVANLHWILVEDSNSSTKLVSDLLKSSQLMYTHLHMATRKDLVREKKDPRWRRHRGVDQRNHALLWIRTHIKPDNGGVLYFGDDDNTYHLDLFKEMRYTENVSMWPVALVGGLRFEGPICSKGKVIKFYTAWMPSRQFPVDMAAFAINLKLIFQHPHCHINADAQRGFLETDFLQQLEITVDDVEARANDCTKILIWHTQTAEPNMKQEMKLKRNNLGSNPNIII